MLRHRPSRRSRRVAVRPAGPVRRGVAAVEFAFILPVLVTLTLGTMDVCSVIFMKEAASIAAYEGARQGVNRGRTNADAIERITEFLDNRNIQYDSGSAITISSPGFDTAETLESVTVTVRIPTEGNLFAPTWLFDNLQIAATCTLRKEYQNVE